MSNCYVGMEASRHGISYWGRTANGEYGPISREEWWPQWLRCCEFAEKKKSAAARSTHTEETK